MKNIKFTKLMGDILKHEKLILVPLSIATIVSFGEIKGINILEDKFNDIFGYSDEKEIQNMIDSEKENDKALNKHKDCTNLNEMREFSDISYPTYDDVRYALNENDNIDLKYKEVLNIGLDNLEKNASDLELFALYNNIKDLTITEKILDDEIGVNQDGAYLDSSKKTVFVNRDTVTPYKLFREVIGKGLTQLRLETSDVDIIFDTNWRVLDKHFNSGYGLKEGVLDLICDMAVDNVGEGMYDIIAEDFKMISKVTDYTINDYLVCGACGLINRIDEIGINNGLEHIVAIDELVDECCFPDSKVDASDVIENFFMDYVEEELNSGSDKKDVINSIGDIINSTNGNIVNTGFMSVNMENLDSKISVETQLLDVAKKR